MQQIRLAAFSPNSDLSQGKKKKATRIHQKLNNNLPPRQRQKKNYPNLKIWLKLLNVPICIDGKVGERGG